MRTVPVDIDGQRSVACDESVNSQIEFLPSDKQWIVDIAAAAVSGSTTVATAVGTVSRMSAVSTVNRM